MNNAPAVYMPTQPEGNGLTLPMLLSLLAHGIVLGVLIYTYQQPELELAGSIETTMVTPGELAEMQGQILANRAMAAQAANSSSGSVSEQTNSANPSSTQQNNTQPNSQQVPVFMRSDEPTSNRPMLMSEEQHQRLLEQSQDYDNSMAEWAAELDNEAMEKLQQVEQNRQNDQMEQDNTLKDFRAKSTEQAKVTKPKRGDRNINIELGDSGSSGNNFDLADGQATVSGGSSSGNKSSGGSRGASNGEIINLIRRNYNPPTGAKGSTQRTTLSITVNANGDVVSVSASGSNEAVNEAAKQAVRSARNLPIDTSDPKYPTFTIQFNGSN